MGSSGTCRECGTAIPAGSPGGFCAQCLLRLGLETADRGDEGVVEPNPPEEQPHSNESKPPSSDQDHNSLRHSGLVTEKPGDRIGRYRLLEEIGHGGCGVVYMAEQEEPVRRKVALKVIKLGMDTRQFVARFEAERQALAMMDHPNIARVLDAGATDTGRPYLVMELVGGVKITDYCAQNQLTTRQRLDLFIQVCRAIQHAHQKGIIHRDIKPSNVLVSTQDGVPVPKVIDFGIAKATQGRLTDQTVFTAFEQFLGTPAYMSPEQAQLGGLDVDTRSDIYSLGVLLYELLTGKTPFDSKELLAAGLDAMRRIILEKEPPTPSTRLAQELAPTYSAIPHESQIANRKSAIDKDLDWIVMKCLEKDRARRYETANGLAMDIERHLNNEPVVASPPGRFYRFRKLIRRNRATTMATLVVAVVLVLGVVASAWQAWRATVAERRSIREAAKRQQVAQLLQEMLQSVGPSVARGRDITLLREILERTAERLDKDLAGQPEVEADLRTTLGVVYGQLGDYTNSAAMHQKALQLRRRFYGKENLSVAESLDRLAEALRGQGQLAEAEASGREALALRSRLSAASDANIASSQGQLATTLMFERKYQEAEKLHREALAKHRELLGNTNLAVAGSLLGLALVLEGDGHAKDVYPEAERLTREALSIHATINGYDDPNVGHLFDALGTALEGMGKYPDAERAYRDGLVVRRRLLGDMHPDLAWSYLHVGGALKNQGKLAEAEESLRKALAIREKAPSSAHIGVSYAFQGLCDCLQNEGKYAEEERTFREWVEWAEKSGDSAGATNALAGLTGCFQAQKKYAEQERIYREWIELAEKSGDHSGVSSALAGLAGCFQAQEKYADQERTYRELLEWAERSGDHAGMIKALMGLARSLETQGEYSQAEQSLRKCALMARNSGSATEAGIVLNNLAWLLATGPDSTLNDGTNAIGFAEEAAMTTARTNGTYLDTLAAAYARAGQFSNAATIQKEAIGLVKDEQSKKDYSTRLRLYESGHAYRNHAVLAERVAKLLGAGRFDEAEPLARECLIIRAMEMPGHWITCNARVMLGGALSGQKNYAAAEPFLLEGYDGLKHHEAAIPKPRLKEAIEYLMILYKATERTEEVERWKMKLTEWYREEGARRRHAADSGDLRALNDAAWLLATCEDSAARDGSAAIGYAEKAVTATNRKDHSSLDTLAAAYAEGRQFAKAVSAQKEALALVQNESLRQGLASRLKLYESNTPYREH